MNQFQRAFENLLDSQERNSGVRKKVTLRGDEIDALIGPEGDDTGPAFGGTANESHTHINIRHEDAGNLPLLVGEKITISDVERDLISYSVLEGSISIQVGSLEEEG